MIAGIMAGFKETGDRPLWARSRHAAAQQERRVGRILNVHFYQQHH
jgi:hypothetical protein